jgi:uncharacterized protein YbaR (Trm112 family)
MRLSTIDKLCCPFDKSDLELTIIKQTEEREVLEGFLTCSQCNRLYPFVKGIPIMSPDEYREFSLEKPLLERWQSYLKDKEFKDFRLIGDG